MVVVVDPGFLMAIPFLLVTLLVIACAVGSLGVLLSIRCRTSIRAMGATLAIGLFVGGGYLFCCVPMMIAGHGAGDEIILAPCIPFLLAFPGIVQVSGGRLLDDGAVAAAYVMGVIGYFMAAIFLSSTAVGMFDELAGRVSHRPIRRLGPPSPPVESEAIEAQVIEEEA
jgi:hypothetical protein